MRRQEAKTTPELRRTRYIWLKDKQAWNNRQIVQFADLKGLNLKTHRAFRIKETLREIFRTAPAIHADRFRSDLDVIADQDITPRG